jgi:hypothetical protein
MRVEWVEIVYALSAYCDRVRDLFEKQVVIMLPV